MSGCAVSGSFYALHEAAPRKINAKNTMKTRNMKLSKLAVMAITGYCMIASSQAAVILAQYDFDAPTATVTTVAASTEGTGVTAGNFTATGSNIGISGSSNHAFLRVDQTGSDQTAALADDDYFSFTISAANSGERLNLTNLTLLLGGNSNTGNTFTNQIYLVSNLDSFGSAIGGTNTTKSFTASNGNQFNTVNTTFDLSGASYQGLETITFQLRFSDDATNSNLFNRFDDVTVNGTVDPIPEPSAALLGALGLLALLRRRR